MDENQSDPTERSAVPDLNERQRLADGRLSYTFELDSEGHCDVCDADGPTLSVDNTGGEYSPSKLCVGCLEAVALALRNKKPR